MIPDSRYLEWQMKIAAKKFFRRFWVFWGIYSFWLIMIASLMLIALGQIDYLILTFISFVFARLVLSPLIYLFYKKPRPYQKIGFQTIHSNLFSKSTTKHNSFPSDHAISFATISIGFYSYSPALGITFFLIAVLNGMARVVLGYHYWIDIVMGWIIGILSFILIFLAVYALQPYFK